MRQQIDLAQPQGAIFSDDAKYRYALWRIWSQARPLLMFVGLNPSKAGQISNDPTITRLMVRADREGYGGLLAANIYGMVTTNPRKLLEDDDPVGPETDDYLRQMLTLTEGKALCGWGAFSAAKLRTTAMLKMIPQPYCLRLNADGSPQHPLYINYGVKMKRYLIQAIESRV